MYGSRKGKSRKDQHPFSPTPLLLKTGPIFGGCLAFNSEPPPSPEPISKTLGRFDSRHIEVLNDIYEEMGEK